MAASRSAEWIIHALSTHIRKLKCAFSLAKYCLLFALNVASKIDYVWNIEIYCRRTHFLKWLIFIWTEWILFEIWKRDFKLFFARVQFLFKFQIRRVGRKFRFWTATVCRIVKRFIVEKLTKIFTYPVDSCDFVYRHRSIMASVGVHPSANWPNISI